MNDDLSITKSSRPFKTDMKQLATKVLNPLFILVLISSTTIGLADSLDTKVTKTESWFLSLQYLGITFHPDGGGTPEIYPLKLDKRAYFVVEVGGMFNVDYCFNQYAFIRFTSALYKDCAFVTAGCFHLGPRMQVTWGKNRFNGGVGPTLLFRQDWHRFKEYTGDEFYGNRIFHGWQYRFIIYGGEFEYLRKLNDNMEFQYSLIPGVPIVLTSVIGIRFKI